MGYESSRATTVTAVEKEKLLSDVPDLLLLGVSRHLVLRPEKARSIRISLS